MFIPNKRLHKTESTYFEEELKIKLTLQSPILKTEQLFKKRFSDIHTSGIICHKTVSHEDEVA